MRVAFKIQKNGWEWVLKFKKWVRVGWNALKWLGMARSGLVWMGVAESGWEHKMVIADFKWAFPENSPC